jgi:hypothetical protein
MKFLLILIITIIITNQQITGPNCTQSSPLVYLSFDSVSSLGGSQIEKDLTSRLNHGIYLNGANSTSGGDCGNGLITPNPNSYVQINPSSNLIPGQYYSIFFKFKTTKPSNNMTMLQVFNQTSIKVIMTPQGKKYS